MQSIADRLLRVADVLASTPDADVDAGSILLPGERERLAEWASNPLPYPRDATIGALFSKVAADQPETEALVSSDEVVRYDALEARANRLAHYLRARLARLRTGWWGCCWNARATWWSLCWRC